MNGKVIINAAATAQLPDTAEVGKPITIQLAPAGRYPQVVDDASAEGGQREVVQVLDEKAMNALVSNFESAKAEAEAKGQKYGVLVDADHSSETSTNTAAMGWVTKLFIDPEKGLMAEIDPTSEGVEKINGKVYRFVSGAWTLDDDDRPERLVSIGLTNKPNLPVAPMINSAAKNADGKDGAGGADNAESAVVTHDEPTKPADADGAEEGASGNAETSQATEGTQDNPENKEGIINMDIKEKLGLPPEATDAEVDGAIDELIAKAAHFDGVKNALNSADEPDEAIVEGVTELVNMCGELKAQNEAAEAEKVANEAEAFVAENEDVIPEEIKEEIVEEYKEDPEKAQETVANFRKVHDRAVLNAAKPKTEPRKPAVFRNSEAKRPAETVGMAAIIAQCGGDPVAINAAIAKMGKH